MHPDISLYISSTSIAIKSIEIEQNRTLQPGEALKIENNLIIIWFSWALFLLIGIITDTLAQNVRDI